MTSQDDVTTTSVTAAEKFMVKRDFVHRKWSSSHGTVGLYSAAFACVSATRPVQLPIDISV